MTNIPKRAVTRFNQNVKKFAKILAEAKSRDINESDTVNIINDMLSEIFGFDKYLDITSEYQIRGTFCDLAVKHGDDVQYLIECKAIGSTLKENHLKQAIDYASRAGIDWAVLTNGIEWEIYKVHFGKPVGMKMIASFDFLEDNVKDDKFNEKLFLLSKEGIKKSAIESFHKERKAINKHTIAAILFTDDISTIVRRKLRAIFKDVNIDKELIGDIIRNDIVKRELTESDQIKKAIKLLKKTQRKKRRRRTKAEMLAAKQSNSENPVPATKPDDIDNETVDNGFQ